MILTCPECSARYVVDPKALLPDGRAVRCAKCAHSWREEAPDAQPLPDTVDPVNIQEEGTPGVPEEGAEDAKAPEKPEEIPQEKPQEKPAENPDASPNANLDLAISSRRKRPRPIPKGSNLPALQGHRHGSGKWGWIALVAFVTLIISSFLIFQDSLSSAWPPSQKLYDAIGLGHVEESHETETPEIPISERLVIKNLKPGREIRGSVPYLVIKGSVVNITGTSQDIPPPESCPSG